MSNRASFWAELQRRHVMRAAVAHVVFFWLLVQIADTVLPYIGVVDEPVRWAVVAGVALLPVTLVIAWLFEHPWHRFTGSRLAIDVVVFLVVCITAGSWVINNLPQIVHTRTSIVVLPFEHQDDGIGQSLSRAFAYEINSLLMKSKSIDVVGYESATSTLLTGMDALAAAERLGVQHVLSGAIRVRGKLFNVSVDLRDLSGRAVWNSEIEDQLDRLYDVQTRIAGEVQTHLGYGQDSVPVKGLAARRCEMPTEQSALERYYTARHYVESRTESEQSVAEQLEAVALYESLINEYPGFAQARSGLAWALMHLNVYDSNNQDQEANTLRAKTLAEEAYGICDGLGEALVILPNEADDPGNGWIGWEQNLQLWMELQPESTENQQKYIRHLREVGRISEARRVAEKNYALNPLSVRSIKNLAAVYQYEKRYDEAIALEEEARKLGSTSPAFAKDGKRMNDCNLEIDCLLDNIPPPYQPIKEQLRQIYSVPASEEGLETAIQISRAVLDENPWMVNWFNASSCWYDHLTPLFFEAAEVARQSNAYWYWPNLWLSTCGNVWESDGFPAFVEEAGLVDYWRSKGWPDACRPEDGSFRCGQTIYEEKIESGL